MSLRGDIFVFVDDEYIRKPLSQAKRHHQSQEKMKMVISFRSTYGMRNYFLRMKINFIVLKMESTLAKNY